MHDLLGVHIGRGSVKIGAVPQRIMRLLHGAALQG